MSDTSNTGTTSTSNSGSKGVAPDSHSALFGLEGKRNSLPPGAGPGSGIIGTSGHAGAAPKTAAVPGKRPEDLKENAELPTLAGMEHGGNSTAPPGSGSETLTPSQGLGDVPPKV